MTDAQSDEDIKKKLYIEDALILGSILMLFWLGVFERNETWAQWELVGIFLIMLVVFIRRIRRTYRSFKEKQQ